MDDTYLLCHRWHPALVEEGASESRLEEDTSKGVLFVIKFFWLGKVHNSSEQEKDCISALDSTCYGYHRWYPTLDKVIGDTF